MPLKQSTDLHTAPSTLSGFGADRLTPPSDGGVGIVGVPIKVLSHRETIAGIEVVDAAFADAMLTAFRDVMVRHREWRDAQKGCEDDGFSRTSFHRQTKARRRYRCARARAFKLVHEALTPT